MTVPGLLSPDELARIESLANAVIAQSGDGLKVGLAKDVLSLSAHVRVVEAERDELAKIVDDLAALEDEAILVEHNGITLWCRFCRASADEGDVVHHDDCVMARAVRSEDRKANP